MGDLLGEFMISYWVKMGVLLGETMIDVKNFNINHDLVKIIGEIDEFKGAWKALGHLMPERLSSLKYVATIESIGSSTRIEGVKLSNQEVEKLLSNIEINQFSNRDEQEVAGYAELMKIVFDHVDFIQLSENYIKQLHQSLLKYSYKDERHRGEYKSLSNHVEAFDTQSKSLGIVFQTASPFDTPQRMQELVNWTSQSLEEKALHPLIIIAIFKVVFLEIHPFQDGNGRLSRILTTFLLLKTGYNYVPYSSLESIIEITKEEYYLALRKTQVTIRSKSPDWYPWLYYFLTILRKQKNNLEKKIKREKIFIDQLSELAVEILDMAKGHGRITIGEIVKSTSKNRNTIKSTLKSLLHHNYLIKHGAGRGVWYSLGDRIDLN